MKIFCFFVFITMSAYSALAFDTKWENPGFVKLGIYSENRNKNGRSKIDHVLQMEQGKMNII